MLEGKPLIVCLCGSTKLWDAFVTANRDETLKGNIVLSVGVDMQEGADLSFLKETTEPQLTIEKQIIKEKLDWLHRRKIDLASVVIILQTDGKPLGSSTEKEKEYAERLGKKVEVRWVCVCKKRLIPDDPRETKCLCGHEFVRAVK